MPTSSHYFSKIAISRLKKWKCEDCEVEVFFSSLLLVSISDPNVEGVTAALAALLPAVGSFMTPVSQGESGMTEGSSWPISHRNANYQSHATNDNVCRIRYLRRNFCVMRVERGSQKWRIVKTNISGKGIVSDGSSELWHYGKYFPKMYKKIKKLSFWLLIQFI